MPEGQRLELGSEQYDDLEKQGLDQVWRVVYVERPRHVRRVRTHTHPYFMPVTCFQYIYFIGTVVRSGRPHCARMRTGCVGDIGCWHRQHPSRIDPKELPFLRSSKMIRPASRAFGHSLQPSRPDARGTPTWPLEINEPVVLCTFDVSPSWCYCCCCHALLPTPSGQVLRIRACGGGARGAAGVRGHQAAPA